MSMSVEEALECFESDCETCQCQINGRGCESCRTKIAISALREKQEREKGCDSCTGIVYRQTNSGKILPVNGKCAVVEHPLCYVSDSTGNMGECKYLIYGDNNDEPIDKCKACPLCYSNRARRHCCT